MMKTFFRKQFNDKLTFLLAAATILCAASCRKHDVTVDSTKYQSVKFTITITGIDKTKNDPFIYIVFDGADAKGSDTRWKVNGVTKKNEPGVGLGELDFLGDTHTYVLESLVPMTGIEALVTCEEDNEGVPPYKMSFKAEIGGKVITDDQNVSISVDHPYDHDYAYGN